MRTQVTILRPLPPTSDISGTVEGGWEPFLTTLASIEPQTATEVFKAGQITAQLKLNVSLMWQSGIRTNMRVQTPNGTYIIQDIVNPKELNYSLTLVCLALGDNE